MKIDTKQEQKEMKLEAHTGKNGSSAYEVALENGFTGTQGEWLESLKGEKGDKGERGREIKASVVIGNEASGATEDMCDFLYKDGDDFAQTFAEASALAGSIGVGRVELLSGQYKAHSTILVNVHELAGIGNPEILPYSEDSIEVLISLSGNIVSLENLVIKNSGVKTVDGINCDELYMKNTNVSGVCHFVSTRVCLENCKIDGELKMLKANNSCLTNCKIKKLNAGSVTSGCVITGCIIDEVAHLPDDNILRNNIIGTSIQKPTVLEHLMNVTFGRITTQNDGDTVTRNVEGNSFEIFINEDKNMTVNLYTGNSGSPAKTLSSDVFIFISGNKGDDIVDGDKYQKTLILYLKSTLGVATLSKWIAYSDSDVYSNVKIEITCPPNTYRGVIKNKEGSVCCED